MSTKKSRLPQQSADRITVLTILLFAFALRINGLSTKELWYDELQSVTHAYLPLPMLFESVATFDPHPPLYYSQLHLWMLFGVSDFWIKFNSLLWSMLAVISLHWVGYKTMGQAVGKWAALLLSMLPFAIFYAQEARMYSMLIFLGIWIFFFTYQLLHGNRTWSTRIGLVCTTLAFLYSHGAGFLILISMATYVLLYLYKNRVGTRQTWTYGIQYLALQGIILFCYLPWLYRAFTTSVKHTLTPDIQAIIKTLSLLFIGFGPLPVWARWLVVIVVGSTIVLLLLYDAKSRGLVVSFLLVPIGFCLLISYIYRPIWLHRTLAFMIPFLAVALAIAISRLFVSIKRHSTPIVPYYALLAIVAAGLMVAVVNQQARIYYPWRIRAAAHFLQQEALSGSRIYVPDHKVFWGFNWYFVGPGSVNPLTTDGVVITDNKITVSSNQAMHTLTANDGCYWLVYRTIDATAPFQIKTQEVVHEFDSLLVTQVCSAATSPATNSSSLGQNAQAMRGRS